MNGEQQTGKQDGRIDDCPSHQNRRARLFGFTVLGSVHCLPFTVHVVSSLGTPAALPPPSPSACCRPRLAGVRHPNQCPGDRLPRPRCPAMRPGVSPPPPPLKSHREPVPASLRLPALPARAH